MEITLLVRIMSISMLIRSLINPIGSLVVATGRTELEFYWNLFTLAMMPLAIFIGSQFSIEGVALAILISMVLLFVPCWWFLIRKMLGVDFRTYLSWIMPKRSSYQLITSQIFRKSRLA
jgi:PST family polysaccharide transporter/teichuronic acid exporter